jgi:mannose/fructose-specific phosphotransferase system component IIA
VEGLVLVSHGRFAEGLFDTISQFFSVGEQIAYLSLNLNQDNEDFEKELRQAISDVDKGDGVIIAADLFGGTPCNKAITLACEKVRIVAGVNLGIILEILSTRNNGRVNLEGISEMGRRAIVVIDRINNNLEDEDF